MQFLSARRPPSRAIFEGAGCRLPPENCKGLKSYTDGQETQM
jgi:hypothetical protein